MAIVLREAPYRGNLVCGVLKQEARLSHRGRMTQDHARWFEIAPLNIDVISTVLFNRKDCYMMLSATC